jgi:catalase
MPAPLPARRPAWLPLAGIAAIAGSLALAFAWTAGWIGGGRLTARQMIDAIEANNREPYPGYRRAHSKGVCVAGRFSASGAAAPLSTARVFTQGEVPVLGRLSIAGGDPHGADNNARVRSMALLLRTDDGQQWRTAMNDFPFFPVATPQGFQDQTLASRPDPATGKPDPARMAAFLEQYPEVRRFQAWAAQAPWTTSWANTQFNGVNAFYLRDAAGRAHLVRWSMQPQATPEYLTPEQRSAAGPEFLARDLRERLARGPLRWNLVLTLARDGDPADDPSQPWPEDRDRLVAGTLELTAMSEQATGACRDINYDPLVLPAGIEPSDDPVLAARSAVYAQSYNRREWEIARGEAGEAIGREGAR